MSFYSLYLLKVSLFLLHCKDVRIILILQEGTCTSVTYLEVTIIEYQKFESK